MTLLTMGSLGPDLGPITGNNGAASTAWPLANKAIIVPFYVRVGVTLQKALVDNGATASGNLDIGIYTEGFVKLWSAGSTAQAGTSVPQAITVTPALTIPRGRYYVALAMDNITGTIRRVTGSAVVVNGHKFLGVTEQATAFPLPATLTPAASTLNYIPVCGFNLTTLAI